MTKQNLSGDWYAEFWHSNYVLTALVGLCLFFIGFMLAISATNSPSIQILIANVLILLGSAVAVLPPAVAFGLAWFPKQWRVPASDEKEAFNTNFPHEVWEHIHANNLPAPSADTLNDIYNIASEWYLNVPFKDPTTLEDPKLRQLWTLAPQLVHITIQSSLFAYLDAYPRLNDSPFTQQLSNAMNMPSVAYKLIQPFRHEALKELGLFSGIRNTFNDNVQRVTMEQTKGRGGSLVFPQEYKGPPQDIPKLYFKNTPFLKLLDRQVPFPMFDKSRFEHQHILGARGKGKSTLLSHMILQDIDRVPNVSVMVIDSQYRMIDGFSRIPHNTPILISPTNPVPLNPFRWGNPDDVVEIVSYAFGAIFDTDMTAIQGGLMDYAIRAVANDPEADFDRLQEFILNPRQELIDQSDRNTQTYFREFYKGVDKRTLSGVTQRIMTFRKNASLDSMLNAPTNDLDLPKLLQEGHIILVDTNKDELTSEQTYVFGRLFIALLHNTMRKRIRVDEEQLKPTFIYIDELADYCPPESDDKKFRELLDQARKQRMGFIVAHQRADQVNRRVLSSLEDSAIRTECLTPGEARMRVHGRETVVQVPPFKFPEFCSQEIYEHRYPKRDLHKKPESPTPPEPPSTDAGKW